MYVSVRQCVCVWVGGGGDRPDCADIPPLLPSLREGHVPTRESD